MKINGLINCFLEIYIYQIITHLKFLLYIVYQWFKEKIYYFISCG